MKEQYNTLLLDDSRLTSYETIGHYARLYPHAITQSCLTTSVNSGRLQLGFYNLAISILPVCNLILGFLKFQFCNRAMSFLYYEKDKLLILS